MAQRNSDSEQQQRQVGSKREKQEQKQQKDREQEQFVVPDSKSRLKACLQCGLAKSKNQWEITNQCENCGHFMKVDKSKNISNIYRGILVLINPAKSFIRRRARITARNGRKIKSGAYAF